MTGFGDDSLVALDDIGEQKIFFSFAKN
jgi:hypothetical protein